MARVKSFSELFEQIKDELSMDWEELPITEKQKKVWADGCQKYSVHLKYNTKNTKKIDVTYYSFEEPSLENVLAFIVTDSSYVYNRSFPKFFNDFISHTDIIKASNTFKQCRKLKKKLSTLLGEELFNAFMECDVDF